ncbi:MAG: 4-alpha-glucanotransferase, partial [Actinobacteria bacterium]|nr:4-alpha-glucanotransferase [Actinomycetota bacterium]
MQAGDDFGIAEGWWGVDGTWHATTAGTRAALRRSMGADEHPDGPPESPSLWFVRPGDDTSIWSPGLLTFEDGTTLEVQGSLPAELPPGSHELISDGGHLTRVLSLPSRCRRAERSWGWTLQLPQTRSLRSWGHGDFADLATLARWARGHGAQVLAHNPLGAPIPSTTQQPSPYYSSSRRFWSPLYLRVEQVPGAELLGAELERATAAGCALDSSASIDRDAVWALKSAALRSIWALVRDSSRVGALLSAAQDDDVLMEHARFCALAERFGGGRSSFPPEAAHPAVLAGSAGAALRASIADDVERWRWIQLVADGQLADASRCGAALMSDLAVGFDPDGSDAWIDQDLLATGCRVGAPP